MSFPPISINRIIRIGAQAYFCAFAAVASNCLAQSNLLKDVEPSDSGYYGSVAVAVIRQDTIVIAAESRTTTDGLINPDTTCKITIVDNIVFAATGLLKGNQSALGIVDYARAALSGRARTRYKLRTFQSGVSSLLTSWLNIPQVQDSLAMSSYYRNRHSIQSMFCFFSAGRPVVVEYSFMPSHVGKRFKIGGVYDAGARKPGEIIWIGAMEETDTLMKEDLEFAKRIHGVDAVHAAKSLIQKQMQFTPRIVGGDIDIVLVTPTGANWIQKKQNCY